MIIRLRIWQYMKPAAGILLVCLICMGFMRHPAAGNEGGYPELTAYDMQGHEVKLSDFRGKFVIIDFWASWCAPCLAEITDMKHLNEGVSDYKDKVVHLAVSLDVSEQKWKHMVEKYRMPGYHVRLKFDDIPAAKEVFAIDGVPYYVWINPDGKIARLDAPFPSAGTKTLKKLRNDLAAAFSTR